MPNRRIAVTLEESIAILLEVQSGRCRQDRDYVVAPEPLYKPRQQIVRNGIKERLVAVLTLDCAGSKTSNDMFLSCEVKDQRRH